MLKFNNNRTAELSILPTFLEGETLYSLCARYHHLSGNRLAATTSNQLFGTGTAAMLHDFPAHLSALEVSTKGRLGSPQRIALERTLLNFYAPYQPAGRIAAGIDAMSGEGLNRLKFRLGLPSSRVGASHPLKACAKCINEELHGIGSSYWHLLHQHPSVWICERHDELLMQSIGKSRTHNKLQWVLPHTLDRREWKHMPEEMGSQIVLLQRLAEFASAIGKTAGLLDPHALRQSYLRAFKREGWLTRGGSVRLKAAREEFFFHVLGLVGVPGFDFIAAAGLQDGGFFAKLLRRPRSCLHPSKHLVLKIFLYPSWSDFWDTYIEMVRTASMRTGKAVPRSEQKREQFLSLVAAGGASLAQIAKILDLPYDVARYWLKRADIRYVGPRSMTL